MKKVLFATTALVATASVAAADVRLSGYGRFGLDYNEANGLIAGNQDTNLTSRLRLQFDMSAETDAGVAFGARFRAQAESRDNNANGAVFNGARFFVSSGGFTLGVGNIIGAYEGTPGTYLETRTAGIGIDGAGFTSHVGNVNGNAFNWDSYSSAGAGVNGIEVLGSYGGFSGHISYSTQNSGVFQPTDRSAINVAYSWNDWTAALGHQSSSVIGEKKTVFTVAGNLDRFGVRFAYGDNDGIKKYGLYGNMDVGAAGNILIFVTNEDNSVNPIFDGSGYGIHYSYDLGGGASFEAGIVETSTKFTTAQAGVYFSF